MSQLFASGGQSIGVSASTSVLPMNTQDWSPLGWTVWSLCSPRESQNSSPILQFKSIRSSALSFFTVQLSHPYMTTGKTIALTKWTFVGKVMSLLFNILSRLVITFLPRSKCLLISWMQSPPAVILEPRKIKSATVSPSIYHEVMGQHAMILVFWMLSIKPTFSLSSFPFIKRLFSSSSVFCFKGGVICISEVIGISPINLDSSLWFIQLCISHDVLCVEVKESDNIQPCHTPFPILNQSVVPCPFKMIVS